MRNWWPPSELYNKGMLFWFGVNMFIPLVILFSFMQDCRANGLEDVVIKRSAGNNHLTKLPMITDESFWAGIGYHRNNAPCVDDYRCKEWEAESGISNWGIEAGIQLKQESTETFFGAIAGSKKGLLSAVEEKVNPLAGKYLAFFVSFIIIF